MSNSPFSHTTPEYLWDALLSRQPGQIQAAFASLDAAEQNTVLSHLKRMAEEDGWHPEQRQSALAALETLADGPSTTGHGLPTTA